MSSPRRDEVFKIPLEEGKSEKWYNVVADMPNKPKPYYSPMTGKLMQPEEMLAISRKS